MTERDRDNLKRSLPSPNLTVCFNWILTKDYEFTFNGSLLVLWGKKENAIRCMAVLHGSHGPAEMPGDHSHFGQGSQRAEVRESQLLPTLFLAPLFLLT